MLSDSPAFGDRRLHIVLCLAISVVVALTACRVYMNWSMPSSTFDWENRGHSDFHYGTYLPSLAFRNGDSPYLMDVCEKYQMPRPVPAFSPAVFVLHQPFTWLSLKTANIVFLFYNVVLVACLSWLSIHILAKKNRFGLFLTAFLLALVSRPGHLTLFTGYFTAELAIGVILALQYSKSRPWLSGFGLMLTSFKPNFFIPLAVLMLARRDFWAVLRGCFLCGIAALAGIAWLALFSDPIQVITDILQGQRSHEANPNSAPENSWVRIDLLGIVSRPLGLTPGLGMYLITMVPLIAFPASWLWSRRGNRDSAQGAVDASGLLVSLAMLVAFYHSNYDAICLLAPWFGMTFFGPQVLPELSRKQRMILIALVAVPACNYAATLSFQNLLGISNHSPLWQCLTVANGVALLVALVLLQYWLFRSRANLYR